MNRLSTCFVAAPLLLVAGACAEPSAHPLRLMDAAAAAGRAYTGEMQQSTTIERTEGDIQMERDLRFRFRVIEGKAEGTDRVNIVLALDSLRAALSTPHGRQVYDTRTMARAVALAYGRTGGRPDYSASPEAEDFTRALSGPPPLSLVLDRMFPVLPDSAVRVGDTWDRAWTETGVEAMTVATRRVRAQFRLAGIAEQDGARIAHIEIVVRKTPDERAPADTAAGTLEARGAVVMGADDGVVREADYEEVITGSGMFPGGRTPFRQTTRYRIAQAGSTGAGS